MKSTTSKRKEIEDFLWEWAETQGEWAKKLIQIIISTETNLIPSDRKIIFKLFLDSFNLLSSLKKSSILKPKYTPTKKKILLSSLSNIEGVNKLAKNQQLNFSENLTVIYGENGTGKTGYARILKNLGFSFDKNNIILSDIFKTKQNKKATIKYKSDDVEKEFSWDCNKSNSDLSNISVFNNNCVQISLSDRQLLVSPVGFYLFNIVKEELQELSSLFEVEISKYNTNLTWTDNLHKGTPQQIYISELSDKSLEYKLVELSNFGDSENDILEKSNKELSNLNINLLIIEISNLKTSLAEIKSINEEVKGASLILTSENIEKLQLINEKIKSLEEMQSKGINEIGKKFGIEFYKSEQFESFINAAEKYIKVINKPNYPEENDICVYCLQPLDNKAKDLLDNYHILLNDVTKDELIVTEKQKKDLVDKVFQINTNLVFHQSTFGIDEKDKPIQPKKIQEYNQKLKIMKEQFIKGNFNKDFSFSFKYDNYTKFLNSKYEFLNISLKEKQQLLLKFSVEQNILIKKIEELNDRKLLSSKINEVKTAIENKKRISQFNTKSNSFNTNSISRKTSKAREILVETNFANIFKAELKALRKSHLDIELNFETDKTNSKISHRINKYSLLEILSEGEQKAIALAEFLTELQLDNTIAPVIFDDPVNSLDHKIIDDVAKRLIKLSKERQVIAFTHSILLFNCFLYYTKQPTYKGTENKFYNSKNEYDKTGFIVQSEEEINKVKEYIKKINVIVNNTPKNKEESDIASDGYSYLRSAIELFVEHEIIHGTVKRYQKNISLTQFVKINGNLIDSYKDDLNEIFERCCGFIKAHSNPTIVHNDPTIIDLKADFNDFKEIRNKFL